MHDIIVIGGGPAGLTAAIYAQRNGKSALVLEKNSFGGQITHSPRVENIPGCLSLSGNEFADRLMEQALAQGADAEMEEAVSIEKAGGTFTVRTLEGGAYEGRAVILANGVRHRMTGLAGEEELVGDGISFCAVCDGDFYTGKDVVVAGGGNSALQEALLLSEKCRSVTMLQDLPFFTGEEKLRQQVLKRPNVKGVVNARLTALRTENGRLTAVAAADRTTGEETDYPCDGFFVAIGLIPENEAFRAWADLDANGYYDSGEDCRTKTEGVFTAGDARRKGVRQVATAAADGAVAALAACRYIADTAEKEGGM